MGIDFDNIVRNKAFENIEPERIEAFKFLAEELHGKNLNQSMEIIMNFSKTMPKGKSIGKEEQQAMFKVIMGAMPETDRQKFEAVIKMMELIK